jgi:lariat debranching enzyme
LRNVIDLDVFVSHDWPRHIAHYGDTPQLLRCKQFFTDEVADGTLGSPPLQYLLHALQPRYWFAAHLHVKFVALVPHIKSSQEAVSRCNDLRQCERFTPDFDFTVRQNHCDDNDDDGGSEFISINTNQRCGPVIGRDDVPLQGCGANVETTTNPETDQVRITRFLALDKVLPRRRYLEIIDMPENPLLDPSCQTRVEKTLQYVPEWLAILRAVGAPGSVLPKEMVPNAWTGEVIREIEEIQRNPISNLVVPLDFESDNGSPSRQTSAFCSLIGI